MLHAARWITYLQRFIFVFITIMWIIILILVLFFVGEIHLVVIGTTSLLNIIFVRQVLWKSWLNRETIANIYWASKILVYFQTIVAINKSPSYVL